MSFGGMGGMGSGQQLGMGKMPGQQQGTQQEQDMLKAMQRGMESCVFKSVMSCGMGFALGGVFGLFMASMSYDNPIHGTGAGSFSQLPWKEQVRRGFKDMGQRSFSSAKNFGIIGGIFTGTECCIEGLRAKNDLWNGVSAGCLTGGALAVKAGPQAAAVGCAGFAAFSAAIDWYMRRPSEPDF